MNFRRLSRLTAGARQHIDKKMINEVTMKYNKNLILLIVTALSPFLISMPHNAMAASDAKKAAEEVKTGETAPAEKHKIDKELDACIDKDPSTAGMVECIEKAIKQWDGELNKNYKLLAGALDKEGQENLKKTQLEWIKFRDAEIKLIASVYSKKEGTMYVPMSCDSVMEITKKRALELRSYYELITEK